MSQARQIFTYIKDRLAYEFKFDERNKNGDTPLSIADKAGNKHFKEFFHKQSGGVVKAPHEDKDLMKLFE